jgi:uncharacterized RDD family membrane protein YckC
MSDDSKPDDPGLESEPFPDATPAAPEAPAAPAYSAPPPPPPPPPIAPPSYSAPPPSPSGAALSPYPLLPDPAPRVGYAGFWIRFLAWLIDAILLWVLSVGAHTVIRLSAGLSIFPLWRSSPSAPPSLVCSEFLVDLVLNWLYYALFESSAAQGTLGKQALRLRVTDLSGRRISFARATGRYFAKIVSFITLCVGFVMIAFTGRRQGLHDLIAETVVLRDNR